MNENSITITIDNYKGKKITFTAPEDATVNLWKVKAMEGKDKGKLIEVRIYLSDDEIKVKEENYNG